MNRKKFIFRALLTAGLSAIGCRAKPAPDAGFLQQPSLMKSDASVPFNRIWVNPKYRDKQYTQLYVAPVNTSYVMADNIWEKASFTVLSPDYVKQSIQMLADYQRSAVIKAVEADSHHKFSIADKPGPNMMILEIAIVQIVPSKPVMQAASYYTPIATGVMVFGSLATNSEDQGKGVIAMEARIRDGTTGDVISMAADREHPPVALVDIKALFWWEPAKPICDAWARQFVEIQNRTKGQKIEEIPNFQILVW